jgi:AraC-like DNA-binding protein
VISPASLHLTTDGLLPALPRIGRLEFERAADHGYRNATARRAPGDAVVQITVAGCGALLDARGAVLQRIPRGSALVFVTGQHAITYGYPPGDREPYGFLYANLAGDAAQRILAEIVARHGHVVRVDPDHAGIAALAGLLPRGGDAHRRIAAAANARLACDLLAAVVEANAPAAGADDRLLDQAMDWLRARLDRPVSVAQAAARCGVSREHLTRVFLRRCGEAPAAWLRRQRLRQAELLLRSGMHAVAEVASRCGFASSSHFAQVFRRATGSSPRRFRG